MSKLTKEQLHGMSDFEVNKALAGIIHDEDWWHKYNKIVFINRLMPTDSGGYETRKAPVNYCNTPNDIMPLAFEHSVSLIKMLSGWRACTNNGIYVVHSFDDENPLRAVVCCLILVLQEWKND